MIWRIASSYERDRQICLELHQEILFAVWKALPRFKGNSKLTTFLARIAHNRSITHVTRESTKPYSVEFDNSYQSEDPTLYEITEANNRRDLLMNAIHRLPLGWRQVITLSLEGLTPREISLVLGVNPNIISIRLTRAKKALRTDLKELGNDGRP